MIRKSKMDHLAQVKSDDGVCGHLQLKENVHTPGIKAKVSAIKKEVKKVMEVKKIKPTVRTARPVPMIPIVEPAAIIKAPVIR